MRDGVARGGGRFMVMWSCTWQVTLTVPWPKMIPVGDVHHRDHAGKRYSLTHIISRSFLSISALIAAKQPKRWIITNSIGRIRAGFRSGPQHPISAHDHVQCSKYAVPRTFNTQDTTMRQISPPIRECFRSLARASMIQAERSMYSTYLNDGMPIALWRALCVSWYRMLIFCPRHCNAVKSWCTEQWSKQRCERTNTVLLIPTSTTRRYTHSETLPIALPEQHGVFF